jgi:Protein of unknown function (DUF3025)
MKLIAEWNAKVFRQSPLLAPLHPLLDCLDLSNFPALSDLNALLDGYEPFVAASSGMPLRFVPQEQGGRSFSAQYEPRCYLRGEVQTRENNWHDLFNALVWLTFPKAKAAINARHYQYLADARKNGTGKRCSGRDMLTLLDESGVLVVCADAELERLLRNFEWKELFWLRRNKVEALMEFCLFGHSLCEKALPPYIGITGHGLLLNVAEEYFSWSSARRLAYLDDRLAEYLAAQEHCQSTRELTPVPLLGVPGWAEGNACPDFYDNYGYFRRGRILSDEQVYICVGQILER